MKKSIPILFSFICALGAVAKPLSADEALMRINSSRVSKLVQSSITNWEKPKLIMTGSLSTGNPAFYVFSNSGGTLFLSADDEVTALLGYSSEANISESDISPALLWWLNEYGHEVEWHKDHRLTSATYEKSLGRRDLDSNVKRDPIEPMVKTKWDQGAPYNLFCPNFGGRRCVTGCVATAMAQVINYHQWPENEVPSITYSWQSETLTSPSVILDWSNMLDSYSAGYSESEAEAVGRLMQIAGYSVNMDYGRNESGAGSKIIRDALVNVFGYDKAIDYAFRDLYTSSQWNDLIYNNLKEVGPIVYNGLGDGGGHSFVCDGYDQDGYFHINWGWSGMSDGYFLLSALNPSDIGTGGGTGGFYYNQDAILGIRRPQSGSQPPAPYIMCSDNLMGRTNAWTLTFSTDNSEGGFVNFGFEKDTFTFGVKLVSLSTEDVKFFASDTYRNMLLAPNQGYASYTVRIPFTLERGIYKAYPVYRLGSEEWELVKLKQTSPSYLTISVSDNGVSLSDAEQGCVSLENVEILTPFVSEEPFHFTVSISNSFPEEKFLLLNAQLSKAPSDAFSKKLKLDEFYISIEPGSEADVIFSGVLPAIEAGEYKLEICDEEKIIGSREVIVSSGALIEDSESDYEIVDPHLYNMQGHFCDPKALQPGLYLRKSRGKVEKVLIK